MRRIYRDSVRCRKNRLPDGDGRILLGAMIGDGFLTAEERQDLTELARDGLAEHRLARRANALVLLDRGMSCEDVGRVLLIETIRSGRGTGFSRKTGSMVWPDSITGVAPAS